MSHTGMQEVARSKTEAGFLNIAGPSWCQIHPHGGLCYRYGPRVKPITVQGSCVGAVL